MEEGLGVQLRAYEWRCCITNLNYLNFAAAEIPSNGRL
jgi:hypothetical protein